MKTNWKKEKQNENFIWLTFYQKEDFSGLLLNTKKKKIKNKGRCKEWKSERKIKGLE